MTPASRNASKENVRQDSLLEIGTEEIPASFMPPALEFIKNFSEQYLKENRLEFEKTICWGTPRRFAILISQVAPKSEAQVQEVSGPSLKAAKDTDGNWTQAARGFAASQSVSMESLEIRNTPKGDYIFAVKKIPGARAEKILAELYTELIPAIPFPKKMVWNSTQFKFPRPIRNLVALYGKNVLRISVAGIKSGNKTFGLKHISKERLIITAPQNYPTLLKNNCVLVEPQTRGDTITKSAEQLAHRIGGRLKQDEALIDEVTWLVEHPVALLGSFDKHFLELPAEVLSTIMKKHQKFFSILDENGKLMPHFIAVRNGISEHQDIVRKGYEKVLLARLDDGEFFFKEDVNRKLEYYIEKSGDIASQGKLGTLRNKIERVKNIAQILAAEIHKGKEMPDTSVIERAISLSKFDLTTNMVFEYPELQGVMGEIYARHFGENEKTARAIREHYYPLTAQSELPSTYESSICALADKLESLTGSILAAQIPKGSSDPFGLKRHASGILRIILQNRWDIPLRDILQKCIQQFPHMKIDGKEKEIIGFLQDRFELLMQESEMAADTIYAVVRNEISDDVRKLRLVTLQEKIKALHAVRSHPDFEAVAAAFKRSSNILKQARSKSIHFSAEGFNASLLKEDAEKNLHAVLENVAEQSRAFVANQKYEDTLRRWVELRAPLDQFFDKVMVMDPDAELAKNRLSLLAQFEKLFSTVADLAQIQNRTLA